ncbi:MAG: hypothetical protein VYE15_01055, partial [Myxococcota bacterium]|nr:hypothetical protein [Myxococcota bacterium]
MKRRVYALFAAVLVVAVGLLFALDGLRADLVCALSEDSCHGMATAHQEEGRLSQARELHSQACESGSARSCLAEGGMAAEGQGGPERPAEARRLYQLACESGVAEGCSRLGGMLHRGEGGDVDLS